MNKTFLCPEETRRYKNSWWSQWLLWWAMKFYSRSFLYTEFYDGWPVTTRWCWKYVQLCKMFWMSMVSVVKPDKIDIFFEMETSAILSMSGPMNWSFSSTVLISRFICGQMMSTFSKLGRACCTHWCASLSSFYSLVVSSTICSSIVVLSASSVVFLVSSSWIPYRVCQVCW